MKNKLPIKKELMQRLLDQLSNFSQRHPEHDITITKIAFAVSNRGQGPGWSMYTSTACGIGFETPLAEAPRPEMRAH